MKYINVNPRSLAVSVDDVQRPGKIAVSTASADVEVLRNPLASLVYFGVLYPLRHEEDRARGIGRREYHLVEPDPWLLALAALMWEGMVQGFAWDAIKVSAIGALATLRESGLSPGRPTSKQLKKKTASRRKSNTRVGFSYTQYSREGRPLAQFFLGLQRVFKGTKKSERTSLVRKREGKRRRKT